MGAESDLLSGDTTLVAVGPTREEAIGLKVLSELALLREELAEKDVQVWSGS